MHLRIRGRQERAPACHVPKGKRRGSDADHERDPCRLAECCTLLTSLGVTTHKIPSVLTRHWQSK
eukprot:2130436-Rhodomonas_salina.1